ncbi:beta-galactosidase trimerization domain-containing protein, partial [bacterium]|nr:beta-galactosidase trimerization domain-containing protein [bacterium]
GPLEWLEKWNLRFYNDHTAAKGHLYLRGANRKGNFKKFQRNPRAIRSGTDGPQPLDGRMLRKLQGIVAERVGKLKRSPMRVAYALDDEVSWGAFVVPIPWRLNADDAAYARWLQSYYGGQAPRPQYVTPDACLPQLKRPLRDIDFAPFLDRMSYNDSLWANFLGALVQTANRADPATPCGFVGGQAPNLWGGYDYAKLLRKTQFIEAYNLGSATHVIRSFNPHNALPVVTTHFHSDARGTANDIWQAWYYFAHGNRGMIGWVEKWFDGKTPRAWLKEFSPTLKELGGVQGPKLVGSRWLHDGVAIYYSHPSIQVSWLLDSEAHGKTWVNRGSDQRLGTSHLVREAWIDLLTDSGIQFNFVPYDKVAVHGIPAHYKVLILPACFALSDIEAQRIREFAERGGTVVADFMCGLFDQHGTGRRRGALDDLFGIRHDGSETAADFFGPRLWVEADQDRGFSYKKYRDLFATVPSKLEGGFAVAERKHKTHIVRRVGQGRAVYLNLSPQRYLQYREENAATDARRDVFMKHIRAAGVKPRLQVTGPDGTRPPKIEVTYWHKGERTYLFVVQSAAVTGSAQGGGGVQGLSRRRMPLTLTFPSPVALTDERTGKRHPASRTHTLSYNPVEATLFSLAGQPLPAK